MNDFVLSGRELGESGGVIKTAAISFILNYFRENNTFNSFKQSLYTFVTRDISEFHPAGAVGYRR